MTITKIEVSVRITDEFWLGDINLALAELGIKSEKDVDWKKVKELYQKKMKYYLEKHKNDFSWDWFIKVVKKAKRE